VTRLNAENYLGYNDWRLPNLNELASILNQGESGITTWLVQQGISNLQPSFYWTSSSVAINAEQAWGINFTTGSIASKSKSSVAHFWPLRGGESITADMLALPKTGQSVCYNAIGGKISCSGTGQDGELRKGIEWPNPRFTENGFGTITDDLTGLVWVKNANLIAIRDPSFGSSPDGRVLWPDALEFVSRLNRDAYLGYTDWRLPNRNELVSLINYAESNPSGWINTQGFSDAQQHYWSSGTSAITPSNAWNVFLAGDVSERNKYDSVNGSFVWPVRGGIDNSLIAVPSTTTKLASLQSSAATAVQAAAVTLAVSTSTLPAGTIGTSYSQTLAATGGTTPYTWSKTTGSLPAGFTLSTAGVISGTPTSGVVAVAAGYSHTVALKNNGTVVAWGDNTSGQTTIPPGLSGVVAVTAGYSHTVALKNNGTIVAWGDNSSGQTTIPVGLSGVVAVAAGYFHTVALKNDGTVVAWGDNYYGQSTIPSGLSGVVTVAASNGNTVALKNDGTVVAWGDNSSGQASTTCGRISTTGICLFNGRLGKMSRLSAGNSSG
jgi:hypothetical protein